MNGKKLLLYLLLLAFLSSMAAAIPVLKDGLPSDLPSNATVNISEYVQEVQTYPAQPGRYAIERTHPETVKIGSELTISLKVTNMGESRPDVKVYEDLRPGLDYQNPYEIGYHEYEALKIPYYVWSLTLNPASSQTITYRAIPKNVGMIAFPSAIVTDDAGNRAESAATYLKVLCVPNAVCDPGENTFYCPEDCPSGGADDLCDGMQDNRTDPDCQAGYDPDAGPEPTTSAPTTTKASLSSPLCILAAGIALLILLQRRG
ncbi:MAG: hypothetical protein QHG99_05575 [Methanomicrobiales archaeon]|nr:hypothetical protein [Methanomicrobiales archaeon]